MDRFFVRDKVFYKTALMLALPVVLQNMITIGVNLLDTWMLGEFGDIPIAGSSLANDYINVFHILCMGMGGGAAVLTAQFWGRGDVDSLKRAISIMLRICLGLAFIFTVGALFFPDLVMSIFSDKQNVIDEGRIYLVISAPTFFLMGLSLTLTLILRSIRQVMVPLITSIICFFVNAFFNWVFIFGNLGAPRMEIAGAALGTLIARVVETGIIAVYVFGYEKKIGYRVRDLFAKCRDLISPYFRYSFPVIISDSMLAFGNATVSIIVGRTTEEFIAANAIIATVVRLSTVFTQGLSQASSVITGNTLGRGDTEKAYKQGVTMFSLSVVIGVFAAGLLLALAPVIIGFFDITDLARDIAFKLMYAVAIMVVFQSTQSVLTKGVLRGGGDTQFMMFADVAFLWVASIPLGYHFALQLQLDPFWIYMALKIDWVIKTLLCAWRLKTRKWIKIVRK